ncbi:PspC domain-containing protein [Bariatricus massiliensis]|uniref:PspC domain-containing protein n=1 Tax=Bariatricus massiliensis TaxID=1745713 RepID=A0ABS8DDF6_9FIRM|nr:PspC domain-containing protein [Bariatricus massiliensis]MCB7302560.1 PspC domain-containing protein [Bariatricus massiliensis]MCB7373776.1 PspC domain-containing protein [Bariatricus massiliensis]MCB7386446.1 PspC domain-containing protein [Bariatricus massiliensis]MCB7410608.1 PspC domain-containing protein [Bariatricus massiliensis]MCQ5253555.1 PspC domain-containing protein [Bariatricus massiliensis]
MEPKRLYRSRENRMVCGVCGGLAEYFSIDPTIVRLGLVLLMAISCGTGLLAYFIAAVIIPDQPQTY